jgi:ubiquinone/menaquinone biosynthesis C-methylase UbiE
MADGVGAAGSIWGLDLSWGMLRVSRQALRRHKGDLPIRLLQGDALVLPFRPEAFDAVVLSFTLESFGEAEMPQVLREAARVLRVGGRIGIVSLSSRHPGELVTRMYWWAHKAVPGIIDCRPIDPSERLKEAGFHIADEVERSMWGLRVAIVVAHR